MPAFRPRILVALFLGASLFASVRADETIKIMAANLSSGTKQNYDGGEGNRIFRGLKPDIAMVQEMNIASNSTSDVRTWVNDNFGSSFSVFRETGKSIPNGIVSRYPILSSGVWDDVTLTDREFVWAKIDIPGDKNLWAISVHLKASSGSASQRNAQAGALKTYIQDNVPSGDYVVIAGDFNTANRSESCVTTFSTFMSTAGPYPADGDNDPDTNSSRGNPYDWVLPNTALAAKATPLKIGASTFANGLVFDSRVYKPLSEVSPVQLGDSGATGMQHMGVVRAFLIPTTVVVPPNTPPVISKPAAGKASVSLSRGGYPTAFALSLSATDANGDALSWSIQAAASHGTAGIVTPATGGTVNVSYQPVAGYVGADSFVVQVSDGKGGTDTILVDITVQSVSAYIAWTQDHFAPLTAADQATRWGETADPDGDGYSNLAEFAQGLNPLLADSAPGLLSCALEPAMDDPENPDSPIPAHLLLSYRVRLDGVSPALNYALQECPDLVLGSWASLAESAYTLVGETPVDSDFINRTVRLNAPLGGPDSTVAADFFRLQISR